MFKTIAGERLHPKPAIPSHERRTSEWLGEGAAIPRGADYRSCG